MGATLNWIIIFILQQTAASHISEVMKSRGIFTDLLNFVLYKMPPALFETVCNNSLFTSLLFVILAVT